MDNSNSMTNTLIDQNMNRITFTLESGGVMVFYASVKIRSLTVRHLVQKMVEKTGELGKNNKPLTSKQTNILTQEFTPCRIRT